MTPDDLNALAKFLSSANPDALGSDSLQQFLLLRGAVAALQDDGSPQAAAFLSQTAADCPIPETRALALLALGQMASQGSPEAVLQLFELYFTWGSPDTAQAILTRGLTHPDPQAQNAFAFLTQPPDQWASQPQAYTALTAFYRQAAPAVQHHLLQAAKNYRLSPWIWIVTIAASPDQPDVYAEILDHGYPTLNAELRSIFLAVLSEHIQNSSQPAADALAALFLRFDDPQALQTALTLQAAPSDSLQRALFFFLSGQWAEYERVDFNHTLLTSVYDAASPALRRRILAQSRASGHIEWLNPTGSARPRWLSDLSAADWQAAVQSLAQSDRAADLWKLILVSPPTESVRILEVLRKLEWQPPKAEDRDFYAQLLTLAGECQKAPFTLAQPRRLKGLEAVVSSLLFEPSGKHLIVGTAASAIHFYDIPHWDLQEQVILAPTRPIRTLAANAQGSYLAAAGGDNAVHIFRLDNFQLAKSFTGHTNLIRGLAISADERTLFSAGFDGTVRAWRFPVGGELWQAAPGDQEITGLLCSAQGDLLITTGSLGKLHVWGAADGQKLWELPAHEGPITALTLSPSAAAAVTAGRDGRLCVWNYASGRSLNQFVLSPQTGRATCLSHHPTVSAVFMGDDHGQITCWNPTNGQALLPALTSHSKTVLAAAVSPDGRFLVTSSLDGALLAWDLELFLLTHQNLEQLTPSALPRVQSLLAAVTRPAERVWLAYISEILRRRQQYEIELGSAVIQTGEFDIQL